MAQLIDGKQISKEIKDELKAEVQKLKEQGREICLAVVDAATVAHDLLAQAGGGEPPQLPRGYFVTPDSVDEKISYLAKVLGYGINLALQPGLEFEDLEGLLE